MTLTERFNDASLGFIISHFDSFQFRPETDSSNALTLLKKYRASAATPGARTVTYHRATPGHGRLFADGGLSLQSMPREIRNAIAFQAYDDVDMVNAHPNLLLQFCEQHALPCEALRHYCADRGAVLAELEPGAPRPGNGKRAVLAVLNGGDVAHDRRGIQFTPWMRAFAQEMMRVREAALHTPHGAKYLELAKSKRKNNANNLLGSAINLLLCDLENDVLMATYDFFLNEGRPVDVLVFDGCMVRKCRDKGPLSQDVLDRASEHVYNKTGRRMKFAVKDMASDMLPVPEAVFSSFCMMLREPRYALDDQAAARLFLDDVKDCVRSSMGRLYVKVNGGWTDAPELVSKLLLEKCLNANILRITPEGATSIMSGNVPAASRIVTAAQALIPDDPAFEETMWHSSIGCVCYLNGLWDFRKARFFAYEERPDVYAVNVIPRDFPVVRPPDAVTKEVCDRLLMACLGDADVVRTYLEIIARATAGEYKDKQWAVLIGERDCGKGVLQELNAATWGLGNVNTVLANAFLLQNHAAPDAAKALSWTLDCRFARQTYTNEVKVDVGNRHVKLDGNAIKQFQSGGDMLCARKNHKDERQFRVASKLIMNLNDMPVVSPADAVSNMILIKFPFKFVAEELLQGDSMPFYKPRDDGIKDFCRRRETMDAFTWLVIDAYRPHIVVPCAKVRADTDAYRAEAGDDLVLVTTHFRYTGKPSDFVPLSTVKTFAVTNNLSYSRIKDRLERMRAVMCSSTCINGVRVGRGFKCVTFTPPASQDDDVELP